MEKTARTLQQQVQQDGGAAAPGSASGTAFLQALSEAVDSFSTAMGYAIAVKQLAGGWRNDALDILAGKVKGARLPATPPRTTIAPALILPAAGWSLLLSALCLCCCRPRQGAH